MVCRVAPVTSRGAAGRGHRGAEGEEGGGCFLPAALVAGAPRALLLPESSANTSVGHHGDVRGIRGVEAMPLTSCAEICVGVCEYVRMCACVCVCMCVGVGRWLVNVGGAGGERGGGGGKWISRL